MLSYHQTKRDFTRLSWRRGNQYFRDNRVQGVTLDGDRVLGKVRGSNRENYDTALVMGKNGKIANSKCTCPVHRRNELHCKHVAALAIWLMGRAPALAAVSAPEHDMAALDLELQSLKKRKP